MTEKPEHEGAETDASQEADGPENKPVPTIIVDPALSAPARAAAAEPVLVPPAGIHMNGGDAPHDAGGAPAAPAPTNAGLSDEDAERFAASIRPSWEPPPGQDYAQPAGPIATAAAGGHGVVAATPAPLHSDEELRGVPGSQRRRGLLIVSAAVLGFFALAALGLMKSRTDVPASKAAARVTAKTALQPVQPATPPVPAKPAAAPAVVVAPALTAAAPDPSASATPTSVAPQPDLAIAASPSPAGPQEVLAAATTVPPSASPAPAPPASAAATATPSPSAKPATPSVAAAPPRSKAETAVAPTARAEAQSRRVPALPATVHVEISTRPAHARMTLDGAPIPNPFEADVVKGGKHRIQAHADGHRSADVTLSFDRDRDLDLVLDAIGAPRQRARSKPARVRAAPASPSAKPSPAPAPASTTTARGAGFVSESPY